MDASSNAKSKKYAYSSFIGALILVILGIGTVSIGSLYMMPLSEDLGVTVGVLALQFTFHGIGAFVAAITFGSVLGKIGPKVLSCITAVCILGYFLTLSFAQNAVAVYVGSTIWAFGTSWGGFSIGQTVIAWWFKNNRGKMISFLSIANGVMGIILPLVIAPMIENVGARRTALIEGIITAVLMIVVSLVCLKKQPSAYGLEQYDSNFGKNVNPAAATVSTGVSLPKMTFKQILQTKPLWLTFFAVVLFTITMAGFVSNASPIYQSMGDTPVQAAACVSVYFAFTLLYSFLFGAISDRKGATPACVLCSVIGIGGLLVAALGSGMVSTVLTAILVAGFSVNVMIGTISWTAIYGVENAEQLVGMSSASTAFGSIFGAAIAGRIFDATGSFDGYCYLGVGMVIIGIVLLLIGTNKKAINEVREKYANSGE